MNSMLLIPLYGALTGWCAVYLPLSYVRYSRKKRAILKGVAASLPKSVEMSHGLESKLDNDIFNAEIDVLIDAKLDDLVLVFKQQIPMASTFLVGNLVEKLKGSAKGEIIKMIPGIKDKLVQQAFEKYFLKFCVAGASIGFVFGTLQLAIMLLFS